MQSGVTVGRWILFGDFNGAKCLFFNLQYSHNVKNAIFFDEFCNLKYFLVIFVAIIARRRRVLSGFMPGVYMEEAVACLLYLFVKLSLSVILQYVYWGG